MTLQSRLFEDIISQAALTAYIQFVSSFEQDTRGNILNNRREALIDTTVEICTIVVCMEF